MCTWNVHCSYFYSCCLPLHIVLIVKNQHKANSLWKCSTISHLRVFFKTILIREYYISLEEKVKIESGTYPLNYTPQPTVYDTMRTLIDCVAVSVLCYSYSTLSPFRIGTVSFFYSHTKYLLHQLKILDKYVIVITDRVWCNQKRKLKQGHKL